MPATILDASPTDNLTSKLPFEVILMIFHLVVFATHWKYRPTYHQLHAMRMKLARVSPIWSEFIFTNPSFWTHILLSYSYTEATIAHLGRSGDLPLHLHIQFVRSIVYYAAPPHDTNFLDEIIDARLAIVSPTIDRWRSLYFICDDRAAFNRVRVALLPFAPRQLQELMLCFRRRVSNSSLLDDSDDEPVGPIAFLPWFEEPLPSLGSLAIRGAGYDMQAGPLMSLTHLELDSLHWLFYPTHADYAFVIGHCPNLRDLKLRWVGCKDFDNNFVERTIIFSSSIRSLLLIFTHYPSLGHLASLFRFPNIRHLRVQATSALAMYSALLAAPFFGSLRYLQISNPAVLAVVFSALTHIFPELEGFDCGDNHLLSILPGATAASPTSLHLNPIPHTSRTAFTSSRNGSHTPPLTFSLTLPLLAGFTRIARGDTAEFRDACLMRFAHNYALHVSDLNIPPDFDSIWALLVIVPDALRSMSS
ncbi:hypothetical protein C8J57DRAFT_1716086, partial [Mycena rebaudengoi]